MSTQRNFRRRVDALAEIFAFTADSLKGVPMEPGQRRRVDFAIEEIFTNMIKYSRPGTAEVRVEIENGDDAVVVTLTDFDVEPFDLTDLALAPDANVGLALDRRTPGGLGLHLVRRLVDTLRYDYAAASRESRTSFCIARQRPSGSDHQPQGARHVED